MSSVGHLLASPVDGGTDLPNGSNSIQESGITPGDSNNITGINVLTAATVNVNLNGNVTTATTAFTVHNSVVVVAITPINLTGLQTIDGVGLAANNRVLLVGQLNPKQNGLWLSQTDAWIRPTDFASGTQAGDSYVLVSSGTLNAGTSWGCVTPTAIIDTNSIVFVQLVVQPSPAWQITGANVGGQPGQIFRDTTGNTINFKTIGDGDSHIIITNNTNDVTIGTDATSANITGAIVARDSSGNFNANIITANLIGNVTGNVSGSADSATNFTGSLTGDVTGTQSATVVSFVAGQTSANVATATLAANAATNINTPSTIVKRDASGNFIASTITANLTGDVTGNVTGNLTGNATSATSATNATNFTGSLVGDATGTQGATVVSLVGGQTAANVAASTVLANAATAANTASTIVKRDGSGNFASGIITASLIGNVTGNVTGNLTGNATSATSATNATNFTGSLVGDATGTQGATVVSTVGGQTAANVAAGAVLANAATAANTTSTIVKRDSVGNFSAGTITASLIGNVTGNVTGNLTGNATSATSATTATNFSGSLVGDVTGNQTTTVVTSVGGQTAANVAAGAVLANAATAVNTASTIVRRDGSNNFAAGTITASLVGAASLNVLKIGDSMTGSLTMPAGTTANPSIQFTGSVDTGITAQTANTLSFDTNGTERMNISTTAINTIAALVVKNVYANQATQIFAATGNNQTVVVTSGISLLLLTHTANRTGLTIDFPPSPIDGQIFTIMLGTTNSITFTALAGGTGGATIISPLTGLNPASAPTATANGNAVTYLYNAASNSWYRYSRG